MSERMYTMSIYKDKYEEGWQFVSRQSNQSNQDSVHRIWTNKRKIVSDAGMNFISDQFEQFCKQLNIDQTIISSYHHKSNGQVEACIKFAKYTIKNVLITITIL